MLRRFAYVVGMLSLVLSVISPVAAQDSMARVRVIHASPDAPAVDVFVDGATVLTNVAFPAISDYLSVPAGVHTIAVAPAGAGESAAVITAKPTLEAGMAYTVAAIGQVADIKGQVYTDNLSAPAAGKAHVRVIHASPDAPGVDVKVSGGPALISALAFPNASEYLPVDAGSYNLQVTPAGASDVVIDLPNTTLTAGTIYDVVAVGNVANIKAQVATFTPSGSTGAAPAALPNTGAGETLRIILAGLALLALGAGLALRRKIA